MSDTIYEYFVDSEGRLQERELHVSGSDANYYFCDSRRSGDVFVKLSHVKAVKRWEIGAVNKSGRIIFKERNRQAAFPKIVAWTRKNLDVAKRKYERAEARAKIVLNALEP